MTDVTPAETLVTCMSAQLRDGDVCGMGMGTILPAAAITLASRRHAPSLSVFVTAAGAFQTQLQRVTLTDNGIGSGGVTLGYPALSDLVGQRMGAGAMQFIRPAQIDNLGRINLNLLRAGDRTIRLPGAAGLPELAHHYDRLLFYIPRHDSRTIVERVDFVTGEGRPGASWVVTDLGVFEILESGWRAMSLHSGVEPEQVQERTGFTVTVDSDTGRTPPPAAEELRLLREEVDPHGLRDLELLSAKDRLGKLREIFVLERAAS